MSGIELRIEFQDAESAYDAHQWLLESSIAPEVEFRQAREPAEPGVQGMDLVPIIIATAELISPLLDVVASIKSLIAARPQTGRITISVKDRNTRREVVVAAENLQGADLAAILQSVREL